jgi:hypothetical protein
MSDKPTGSGYFALTSGVVFLGAFAGSFAVSVKDLSPDSIARAWFLVVAAVLIWWGGNRIRTGRSDRTVGQDTINLVLGIVGVTIALLGFLKGK